MRSEDVQTILTKANLPKFCEQVADAITEVTSSEVSDREFDKLADSIADATADAIVAVKFNA